LPTLDAAKQNGFVGTALRHGWIGLVLAALGCAGERPIAPAPAPPVAEVKPQPPPAPPPPPPPVKRELPLGGREIFPAYRLVGFCGTPGAPALGKLANKLPERVQELGAYAKKYEHGRKALPVLELIAVVVQGVKGPDGMWRRRVTEDVIEQYLRAARDAKALLLLNVQPGQSDFMTEVKLFEKYLKEPDVGIALDPEWAMKPKQKPGVYYGQSNGPTVNEVAAYLQGIVQANDLPEKVLVFHQMNEWVFKDEAAIKPVQGIVIIKSIDGLGPKAAKINTYNYLMKGTAPAVHAGFKLFFDEDTQQGRKLMSPDEVLALRPKPEYVMYE
jgi:hypothetical protein